MSTRLEDASEKVDKTMDKASSDWESDRKAYGCVYTYEELFGKREETSATTTPRTRITYSPHLPHNVECSECKRAITGRLFTCLECDDYHLCHGCERSGRHVEHPTL